MTRDDDPTHDARAQAIERYLHLTRTVMPALAQTTMAAWPVRNDHCFQRIILDAVCGGVWYDHITRPATKHLTLEQTHRAVQLCEDIVAGTADLAVMNRQSLVWRGKGSWPGSAQQVPASKAQSL